MWRGRGLACLQASSKLSFNLVDLQRETSQIRMIGVKEVNLMTIFVSFLIMVAAEDYPAALYDRPYDAFLESGERRTPEIGGREASITAIRSLVNSLEGRMLKRASYGGPCLGAGMSHNCEFNDLKEALKHVEQISSGHFPGRRKRSSSRGQPIN